MIRMLPSPLVRLKRHASPKAMLRPGRASDLDLGDIARDYREAETRADQFFRGTPEQHFRSLVDEADIVLRVNETMACGLASMTERHSLSFSAAQAALHPREGRYSR